MNQLEVVEEISQIVSRLPEQDAASLLDYAQYLLSRRAPSAVPLSKAEEGEVEDVDNTLLLQQIAAYVSTSPVFAFLHHPDEDVYTVDDLKARYR